MKKIGALAALLLPGLALLSSCNKAEFIGEWKAVNPVNVTAEVNGAESASEDVILAFSEAQGKTAGKVEMTGKFKVSIALPSDSTAAPVPVTFTADARCDGSWTPDSDDDDDLLLAFNYDAITVTVDKNSLAGTGKLSPDQLTSTEELCRMKVENAFRSTLSRYSVVDDVEVSKDKTSMNLELKNPKEKVYFTRR